MSGYENINSYRNSFYVRIFRRASPASHCKALRKFGYQSKTALYSVGSKADRTRRVQRDQDGRFRRRLHSDLRH